jgi:hypothetical protein
MLAWAQQTATMLGPALLAILTALSHVRDVIQDSFVGQELNRLTGMRAAAGMFTSVCQLLEAAGERTCFLHTASTCMQLPLFQAYDTRVAIEGRPAPERYASSACLPCT